MYEFLYVYLCFDLILLKIILVLVIIVYMQMNSPVSMYNLMIKFSVIVIKLDIN